MIAVKNILLVYGPEVEVIRFVYDKRMNVESEIWKIREPAPERPVSERCPQLTLHSADFARADLETTTDWYPATRDILVLSKDHPELIFDMNFEAAPSCDQETTHSGGVEFSAGEVNGWNYGTVGGEQINGSGEDCPVPWWEWSAEAVAAWARFIENVHLSEP